MVNRLYAEFAKYYAEITNDRDFTGQLECIMNVFPLNSPCRTFLELFAGQAFHGLSALKHNDVDVWAIDSSSEMKNLAIANGFKTEQQYIVGNLPDALSLIPNHVKFDCVTCLYHGLSNLNKSDVFLLLTKIKEVLTPNGKLFLEIHDIYYLMEYISKPNVQYTNIYTNAKEHISYAWPSDKIKWDSFSFKAEVPVRIILEENNDATEFTSIDHIYSLEDICFMSELLGYSSRILNSDSVRDLYGISIIIELSIKTSNLSS